MRIALILDSLVIGALSALLLYFVTIAYIDHLTHLRNARSFHNRYGRMFSKGNEFHLIILDLNNLKVINDTQGHTEGDFILKAFSDSLRSHFKYCYRIGGDEFAVICSNQTRQQIHIELNSMNEFDFSYGIATRTPDIGSKGELFLIADKQMYRYKNRCKKEMARRHPSKPTSYR